MPSDASVNFKSKQYVPTLAFTPALVNVNTPVLELTAKKPSVLPAVISQTNPVLFGIVPGPSFEL